MPFLNGDSLRISTYLGGTSKSQGKSTCFVIGMLARSFKLKVRGSRPEGGAQLTLGTVIDEVCGTD